MRLGSWVPGVGIWSPPSLALRVSETRRLCYCAMEIVGTAPKDLLNGIELVSWIKLPNFDKSGNNITISNTSEVQPWLDMTISLTCRTILAYDYLEV